MEPAPEGFLESWRASCFLEAWSAYGAPMEAWSAYGAWGGDHMEMATPETLISETFDSGDLDFGDHFFSMSKIDCF